MAVCYDHLKGIRSPIPSGPAHETAVTARLSSWAHTYTLIQEVMTAGWNLSRAKASSAPLPLSGYNLLSSHTHHLLDNVLLRLNGVRVEKALKRLEKNPSPLSRKLDSPQRERSLPVCAPYLELDSPSALHRISDLLALTTFYITKIGFGFALCIICSVLISCLSSDHRYISVWDQLATTTASLWQMDWIQLAEANLTLWAWTEL
ncbi:uncharacterized protein LOC119793561 [Cyprinodon tularosa]|uniref:uncharacterized protein LOC119793561 n=1 Tax=Cyprinodon tularosa TaxID=77115 RepID=UPI0018E1DF65|nr:uncharacterized protein LOC119793561 [Cyprinodon tularosa]